MSENQQPLDEEQAVSDVQEQETLPAAAEDTLPAAQDENAMGHIILLLRVLSDGMMIAAIIYARIPEPPRKHTSAHRCV